MSCHELAYPANARRERWRAFSPAVLLLATLQPPLASAQSEALPEVVVKAGRLQQSSFDAPAAIQSVDGETIRGAGPQVNLSEALSGVPGVVALNRNNYAQDLQISIRGFGARASFGLQGIRLITDGIPATIPDGQGQASTVSLASVDRIEVLRGPLALLYGNSSGGVIQTFTREAGPQPEAAVQLFAGSNGLARTDWQASARSGKVGIVADLSSFDLGGWRDDSGARRRQLNTVVTIDPQPDTRVRFIANLYDMPNAGDPLGLTAAQLAQNARQAGTNALLDQTRKSVAQNQLGAVLEQRLPGELRFQGRVYYGSRNNLQYQAATVAGSASGSWVGLNRVYQGVGLQLSGRERLANSLPMDWVFGYDNDRSSEQRQGGATLSGAQVGQPNRDERDIASNGAFFGQTNWQLGERWTLVAGARSDQVTLASDDYFLSDGNGSGSVRYTAVTPVLGLSWHVNEQLNLYANSGRGFETPTLAQVAYSRSGNNIVGQFNPGLQASRSQHYELGAKWRPGAAQRLDLALFHIATSNELVSSLSSGGKTAYVNAPRTLRQGVELAWQGRASPHWGTQVSATLMKAAYDSAFASGSTAIPQGNSLPAVPARQLYANLTWSEQARPDLSAQALQGTQLTLEWFARSRLWADDANTAYAGGAGVFNLRLRRALQFGATRVEGFVGIDNLLDRAYVGSVITNQAQQGYYEPALRRSWLLGLKLALPI